MSISDLVVLGDNSFGTIGSGLIASDTALAFTSGHGARFPAVAAGQELFCCILNANNVLEQVKITAHVDGADTATMVRGVGGTTAKAWTAGDRIEARITKLALTELQKRVEAFVFAISNETAAITTGTAKITFRMPYAFTVAEVRASLNVTSSSGIPTFDINEGGVSILSTKLTVDVGELTSTTAAIPAVISDTALADDSIITIDCTIAGTGATGAKIYIIGRQT